jgi:hypothetical protein
MASAPGVLPGGVDTRDQRFGDAGVGAVEDGVVGDVWLLADLERGEVLAVAVDECFDERAVALDITRA